MQRYLKPNNLKIRKEEAQTIFKLRSRVTDVKQIIKENMILLSVMLVKWKKNLKNMF